MGFPKVRGTFLGGPIIIVSINHSKHYNISGSILRSPILEKLPNFSNGICERSKRQALCRMLRH